MLLHEEHRENKRRIRKEIGQTCAKAATRKGLSETRLAELAGYENIAKGVRRVHKLLSTGKTKNGRLLYQLGEILQVGEEIDELFEKLKGETRQYQTELNEESKLLADHLLLILEKSEQIAPDRRLANALISECAFLSMAYAGGGYLPLGTLLCFWQQDRFTDTCEECEGKVYLYGAGGSPLSGSGSMWGRCAQCHKGKKVAFNGRLASELQNHALFHPFQERIKEGEFIRIAALIARLHELDDSGEDEKRTDGKDAPLLV